MQFEDISVLIFQKKSEFCKMDFNIVKCVKWRREFKTLIGIWDQNQINQNN